ncbi:hypothetical protein EVAR_35622_1 [Eumeta japonica]|uniref:Uncharacterized protein n=1 Tax=Eumeta variegata TaxID=151549 RepID=A0A4C1WD38_EUMVA|nr:hypothetical protein EVAR_35622_1 [Eumeta japonica]
MPVIDDVAERCGASPRRGASATEKSAASLTFITIPRLIDYKNLNTRVIKMKLNSTATRRPTAADKTRAAFDERPELCFKRRFRQRSACEMRVRSQRARPPMIYGIARDVSFLRPRNVSEAAARRPPP